MGKTKRCSFCGSELTKFNKGIEGIGAIICHQCLDLYSEIARIEDKRLANERFMLNFKEKVLTPKVIYDKLSTEVVGQEKAKRVLAVALYRHYLRINRLKDDTTHDKANILLIGPTGVGKTLLAKTMAGILNVPLAICDATVYTQAGYVGEDVENILLKLIQNADYDMELAQKGIVFIDEFDKLARKSDSPSITRDVSGEGVQNSLLKIIEGQVISVPPQGGRKHPYQDCLKFDTSDVLFICAGAFEGLIKDNKKQVGFENKTSESKLDLTYALRKYGIIPEILGRLPIVVELNKLSVNELKDVLVSPKHAIIKEYQALLQDEEVSLEFTDDSLTEIAKIAYDKGLGARALKKILEDIMLDYLFDIPSNKDIKKIEINKEYVLSKHI